jgi:hypothetical protein
MASCWNRPSTSSRPCACPLEVVPIESKASRTTDRCSSLSPSMATRWIMDGRRIATSRSSCRSRRYRDALLPPCDSPRMVAQLSYDPRRRARARLAHKVPGRRSLGDPARTRRRSRGPTPPFVESWFVTLVREISWRSPAEGRRSWNRRRRMLSSWSPMASEVAPGASPSASPTPRSRPKRGFARRARFRAPVVEPLPARAPCPPSTSFFSAAVPPAM